MGRRYEEQEGSVDEPKGIAAALIAVAQVRYEAFRERFGRDPEPEEPLLFDPAKDKPTADNLSDRALQLTARGLIDYVVALRESGEILAIAADAVDFHSFAGHRLLRIDPLDPATRETAQRSLELPRPFDQLDIVGVQGMKIAALHVD